MKRDIATCAMLIRLTSR